MRKLSLTIAGLIAFFAIGCGGEGASRVGPRYTVRIYSAGQIAEVYMHASKPVCFNNKCEFYSADGAKILLSPKTEWVAIPEE